MSGSVTDFTRGTGRATGATVSGAGFGIDTGTVAVGGAAFGAGGHTFSEGTTLAFGAGDTTLTTVVWITLEIGTGRTTKGFTGTTGSQLAGFVSGTDVAIGTGIVIHKAVAIVVKAVAALFAFGQRLSVASSLEFTVATELSACFADPFAKSVVRAGVTGLVDGGVQERDVVDLAVAVVVFVVAGLFRGLHLALTGAPAGLVCASLDALDTGAFAAPFGIVGVA